MSAEKDLAKISEIETSTEKAAVCKDMGTDLLKQGAFADAAAKYKEGVDLILSHFEGSECIKPDSTLAKMPQFQSMQTMYVSLCLNASMAYIKETQWSSSIQFCRRALLVDTKNVKGHFRLGTSLLHTASYEDAREALLRVVELDPTNRESRRLLQECAAKIKETREKEKSNFKKLFDGQGLYDDKMRQLLLRREAWTKHCNEQEAKGEEPPSFEEYEKQLAEKKNKEKKKPAASKPKTDSGSESKKPKRIMPKSRPSDVDIDEDEQKMLAEMKKKGYCYFRTEKRDDVPDSTPVKIDAPIAAEETTVGSAWNSGGTWEEKDMTTWCTEGMKRHLEAVSVADADGNTVTVTGTHNVSGEANQVVVRSQKKCFYDFKATVDCMLTVAQQKYKAVVRCSEVTDHSIATLNWAWKSKTKPSAEHEKTVEKLIAMTYENILKAFEMFFQEYRVQ